MTTTNADLIAAEWQSEIERPYVEMIDTLTAKLAESQSEAMKYKLATEKNADALREAQANAAHWKNNHATEVRRARTLKERTDMPLERVQAYEQWGKDLAQLAEAMKDAERYRWLRDDTIEIKDGQRALNVVMGRLPFDEEDRDEDLFGLELDDAIDAAMASRL